MTTIAETVAEFNAGNLTKSQYIQSMYDRHHSVLFDFASHLKSTNIQRIEIEDGRVIVTTRDRQLRMIVPPIDQRVAPIEILNFNAYEPNEGRMLERLLPENGVFLDIGGNMGWYALNAALARPNASIHCFEPVPPTFASLQKNIVLNGVRNITAHNCGLSDRDGTLPFYCDPKGSGNASSKNLTNRNDIPVHQGLVRTLDSFIAEHGGRVDLIKCDVEGAELLVFLGGAQTIASQQPAVCCEILRKWSARFGYNPNEIFTFFAELGYRAFVVRGGSLIPFEVMDESTEETNFIFLHENRHSAEIVRLSEA